MVHFWSPFRAEPGQTVMLPAVHLTSRRTFLRQGYEELHVLQYVVLADLA